MAKRRTYSKYTSAALRQVQSKKAGKRWKGILKYKSEDGKWRQVAKTFGEGVRTKTQANAELQKWRDEMEDAAKLGDGARMIVKNYITECIDLRSRVSIRGFKKLEDSTALDYKKVLRKLSPDFDNITIAEVTSKFVNDWYEKQLKDGVSEHAVRKCHRLLSMAFRYAFKKGDIPSNPMELVDPPEVDKKEVDSLTQDDMRDVTAKLESMEPTPVVVAAYIGLHAGLRCAEVCALRWRDIDFRSQTITVSRSIGYRAGGAYEKSRTKTGKSRTIGFDSPHMADVLMARKKRMLAERDNIATDFQDLFVVGSADGDYAKPNTISRHWTALTREWGLKSSNGGKCNFQMLRHSYRTAALEAGGNLKDVSENAGHASVAMTGDVYAKALNKGKREAAQAAGEFMRPRPKKQATIHELRPAANE